MILMTKSLSVRLFLIIDISEFVSDKMICLMFNEVGRVGFFC